jgi:Ca2+-binding EF-hand superfamily protein
MREFIKELFGDAKESDSWDDAEFDKTYNMIDRDGGGQVEREEFIEFVKRFADL